MNYTELFKLGASSAAAVLLLVTGLHAKYLIHILRRLKPQVDVPMFNLEGRDFENAKHEYLHDPPRLVLNGYNKVHLHLSVSAFPVVQGGIDKFPWKDDAYQLWTQAEYKVMLSLRFMQELKDLPRHMDVEESLQNRKVLHPVILFNGLVIPRGLEIAVPASQIATDPDLYDNLTQFLPFRFADKRKASKEEQHNHQYAMSSNISMAFGTGHHICPARFLVSNLLKMLLVEVLREYDNKLVDEDVGRPKNYTVANITVPCDDATIFVRKR
ncbi:MAG: hypothetical protein Q9169_006601 [Polycauliona sp. 2 TL-2023]